MQKNALTFVSILVLAAAAASLTGCDGVGLWWSERKSTTDSGDQTPSTGDGTSSDGTVTPPSSTPTGQRFAGTWIAAFGDDYPTAESRDQFAARLIMTQAGTGLTGQGTLFRIAATAVGSSTSAVEEISVTVVGTVDTNELDANLTLASSRIPTTRWYLRATESGLVGIYQVTDGTGAVTQSGHARWFKLSGGSVAGAWVGGFSDGYGDSANGFPQRSRTGLAALSTSGAGVFSGNGSFDIQVPNDPNALPIDFNVTNGLIQGSKLAFTFSNGGLGANDYDSAGFISDGLLTTAYAQFMPTGQSGVEQTVRTGHGLWHLSGETVPDDVSATWVSAWTDDITEGGGAGSDYLAVAALSAQSGGPITANSASLLDESASDPAYYSVSVSSGNILGSRVVFDLSSSQTRFAQDLRLSGSLLTGTYQRIRSGAFAGSGTVEWRQLTDPDLAGNTWAAAYVDTSSAVAGVAPATQFALMTITSQDTAGNITGTGALRYAGDTRRRLFNASGTIFNGQITIRWISADGFGDTVWHMRQAGSYLYGTYTNYTANGAVEYKGNALFVRSQETRNLTP